MLAPSTGIGFALTVTSSDARFHLGEAYSVWDPTYGELIYRYVQNKSGGALAQGLGVMQEDGTDFGQVTLSAAAIPGVRMVGVAQWAIAADYYGFVLCRGIGKVKASAANITANTGQKMVANGLFTDGTIGTDDIVVFAHEAATSGNLALATIKCL